MNRKAGPRAPEPGSTVLVLNGPNLDRLGTREPEIYGHTTLPEIEQDLRRHGTGLGVEVVCVQTADPARLAAALETHRPAAVVINPASLTHYSYALRDALQASGAAVYEVHISNIYAREPYRRHSVISPVARGVVAGLGVAGYRVALEAAARNIRAAGAAAREDAASREEAGR